MSSLKTHFLSVRTDYELGIFEDIKYLQIHFS